MSYGYARDQWDAAKAETRAVLIRCAQTRELIAYSDVVPQVASIHFTPDATAFHELLGEISRDEVAAGRGMLSVVVVHKDDTFPGKGFFTLAKQLGFNVADQERFWIAEVTRV